MWTSAPVNAGGGSWFESVHFDVAGVTLNGNTRYWLGMTVLNNTFFALESNLAKFSTSGGFAVLPGFLENKGQGWTDYLRAIQPHLPSGSRSFLNRVPQR